MIVQLNAFVALNDTLFTQTQRHTNRFYCRNFILNLCCYLQTKDLNDNIHFASKRNEPISGLRFSVIRTKRFLWAISIFLTVNRTLTTFILWPLCWQNVLLVFYLNFFITIYVNYEANICFGWDEIARKW